MNLDENLCNAVNVLRETYNNLIKLLSFLKVKAPEYGFRCVTNDFLIWQSKSNTWGWVASKFTLLFQYNNSSLNEKGWTGDDIFGMEICLDDEPGLYISKFTFTDGLENVPDSLKSSDEWVFTHPKWNKDKFYIQTDKDGLIISKPQSKKISQKHWGMSSAVFKRDTFFDLTAENVYKKIFAVMNDLKNR